MEHGGGMTGSCRGSDEGEWEVQGSSFHLQTHNGEDSEHKRMHGRTLYSRDAKQVLYRC